STPPCARASRRPKAWAARRRRSGSEPDEPAARACRSALVLVAEHVRVHAVPHVERLRRVVALAPREPRVAAEAIGADRGQLLGGGTLRVGRGLLEPGDQPLGARLVARLFPPAAPAPARGAEVLLRDH